MFVRTVFPQWLNLLQANLAWLMLIMNWSVMQKDWFDIFKATVTMRAHI